MLTAVQKAQGSLEAKLGRQPTLAELGAEVALSHEKLAEVMGYRTDLLSLSQPVVEDGDAELGDVVADSRGA